MTATTARGTGGQMDISSDSRTPVPLQNDSAISPHFTSTSTYSTASSSPLTPSRGRQTNRYPDTLGRVPLHRRGTSKTYERLEDLLREAGYKETRVFTPDADHNSLSGEKHDGGVGNSMRGSVGAVVDFITGLVSRGPSFSSETAPLKDSSAQAALHAWSPPPSPSAHVLHRRDDKAKRVPSMASFSRTGSSESVHHRTYVDMPPDMSQRIHAYQVVQLHQSSQGLPHYPHSKHRTHQHLLNNRRHQLNYSSKSTSTKPNTSNARAYLRHMASAPNIQPLTKRPSLSESSLRAHAVGREHRSGIRHTFVLHDEDSIAESDYESRTRVTIDDDEHQVHPPLPRNWIDSVAKALLSGVGGPAAVTSDAASTRTANTWKSAALSDTSNRDERGRATVRAARPPFLCAQVQDMKARTSEGQVACTRVMCRSTPTSRTSSRVRNSTHEDHANIMNNRKRKEGDKSGNRERGKDRRAGVVPSLARTRVENDDWMAPRQRYSGGWGMHGSPQSHPDAWSDDSDGDDDDDDDDDDEGELGLDRLLVPARRQHSIQSLRRHLQRPSHRLSSHHLTPPRSGRASPFGASAGHPSWGDASWGTSRGREWVASRGEEDEEGYIHTFSGAKVGNSGTKWRRGLPGLPQWTTSS